MLLSRTVSMAALGTLTAFVLQAAPSMAQTAPQRPAAPAGQQPAPRPTPPAGQQPAAPAPAPQPAPAQTPAPPAPFPAGAKIGVVNLQTIASLSAEGKASTAKIQTLVQKKQTEAAAKTKALQDGQTRLQQQGALMNEAARSQL